MFQGRASQLYYRFIFIISIPQILSTSISFSYRTCLPNVELIRIDHSNSEIFRLVTKNFRLNILSTNNNQQAEYEFGSWNLTLPHTASFDYQFQTAIDYYHEIDRWHYVNITFDDRKEKVWISFDGDETRLIPLIDYFWPKSKHAIDVHVLLDQEKSNVTCFLAHSGFEHPLTTCSINIKTCEHQTCTSSEIVEQFCPLFKIFDCRPFTNLECGLKTIPVRCSTNHCQNRGFCYVDLLRNVTQCVCQAGFAGHQCEYSIDECQSNPCPKHSHCIDMPNGYTCVCDPGWTGHDCSIDIDECETIQPCKAARTCVNLPGSYRCECLESFGGQNCEMTLDPCLSQPCLNDALQCHPILESENVVFRCTCQPGFTGDRCETNINDCEGIICPRNNTQCIDGINSFDCQCINKFKRARDGSCIEQNACDSSPCYGNATCYNLNHGQFRCMCPATYTGEKCDIDIDECTVFPSICRNGGRCINEIGSYRCYCEPGWTGASCAKAIDFCLSQPCNRNGTCINKINGFECRCLSSFTGEFCQDDIDECMINPCVNNGTCHNYFGGFYCQCPYGYYGNHCEYSPFDCRELQQKTSSHKCLDPTRCIANDTEKLREINKMSTFSCQTENNRIVDGYFNCLNEGSSNRCRCPKNLLPCNDDQSLIRDQTKPICPCRNDGKCFWSNETDYRCYCPPGLTGRNCLDPIDLCLSNPCYNNGSCISQLNKYSCQCPVTARGVFCQEKVDPCEKNPCENNGTCEISADGYHCRCSSELYSGNNCEIIRNPCWSNPCQNDGSCIDERESFRCHCSLNFMGQYCEEHVNLCRTKSNGSLCLNGGFCRVNDKKIECSCLPGFTGLFCETNIDDCYTKPCSPHGDCIDLINGYQCQCQTGWYGYNCDREKKEFAKSLSSPIKYQSVFQFRNSSLNISRILPKRQQTSFLRIQYEFRTTLNEVSLLAIGDRFQQEFIRGRVMTNFDKKIVSSNFIENQQDWTLIVVEIYQLWIDVRIGKNSMSQRFYVSPPSLLSNVDENVVFGYQNYSGCARQIEIFYSSTDSILLTDQFVELNENLTVGCERTNACVNAVCRKNELCEDHWFYYRCQCQSPFFGELCDQISPILMFNRNSSLFFREENESIRKFSFFINTFDSNGTIFQANFSSNSTENNGKMIGRLVDGRFRLIFIEKSNRFDEFEIRITDRINDGRAHRFDLNFDEQTLTIDGIDREKLQHLVKRSLTNEIEFLVDRSLTGWFQDIRINDEQLTNKTKLNETNFSIIKTNPCYPVNPCANDAICLVTPSFEYRCQCSPDWFGRNCTESNLCPTNRTSRCPNGFRCNTVDQYQECLAIATFQGNQSRMTAHFLVQTMIDELFFKFRARPQSSHLFTIKNVDNNRSFSLFLDNEFLLYRDSLSIEPISIEISNRSIHTWNDFHMQWFNQSILIFNGRHRFDVNLTAEMIFTRNQTVEIYVGGEFRGCLDQFRLGKYLYLPFYDETQIENDTRTNRIFVRHFDHILINNCSFENLCENVFCKHGLCQADFDRAFCLCNRGWQGEQCQTNINECLLGNNCSKEHSICQDQLDGYYTCKCHQGFTGKYCETNIDDCASSPCENGALCTDLVNGYVCNCTKDFIGANCSVPLNQTCLSPSNPCQHNGTCLLKSVHLYVDHPKTECQCLPGYNGSLCENDLCSYLNCENGGTCQRLLNGQAQCLCTSHWKGLRCEQDVNECEKNQTSICLNGGVCINNPGGYKCRCSENYLGEHCEQKHICLQSIVCYNNGQCRPDGAGYRCECTSSYKGENCQLPTCESLPCQYNGTCLPDEERGFQCNCTDTGYEGDQCESEINECLSNPCLNNGTCIDQVAGFICSCPKNFLGFHCEEKRFLALLGGFSYHYVIWPSVAIILLLIIILLSIVIGRVRESRRSRGTYRPALNENGQTSRVEFSMILKPPPEERLI